MAKALNVTRFGKSAVDDPWLLRLCDLMTGLRVVFGLEVISPVDAAKSRSFCDRLVLPLLPILPVAGPFDGLPTNKSCCEAVQLTTGCALDGAIYLKQ